MAGQDARPAAMLEEIIVAGAVPQQRQNHQEHGHRMSYADGESKRTDPSMHQDSVLQRAASDRKD